MDPAFVALTISSIFIAPSLSKRTRELLAVAWLALAIVSAIKQILE